MMKCRFEWRSTRNSILPPLISMTALATSGVTVPVFGFGIRPRGPSTRPSRPTLPIRSGVATTASKSSRPFSTSAMSSSDPTMSAPAARASSARSPVAKTRTRAVLPVPCGQVDRAADHLVGLAGVDAEAHGDLDGARRTSWCSSPWPAGRPRAGCRARPRRSSRRRRGRTCCASWCCSSLVRAEVVVERAELALPRCVAGAASLDGRAVDRQSVTVMPIERAVPAMIFSAASRSLALRSGILVSAISRTWARVIEATLIFCGVGGALLDAGGLEDQPRGRRGLGDEGERAVLVDRDLDRDRPGRAATRSRRCRPCRTP